MRCRLARALLRPGLLCWAAPVRTLRWRAGWRPHPRVLAEARRILVIRPDEIGDVVLTVPFLRELRRAAPVAKIALAVKPACRELLEYCPYVDAMYAVDFTSGSARLLRHMCDAWALRLGHESVFGFDLVLLPRRGIDHGDAGFLSHVAAGRGTVMTALGSCKASPNSMHEVMWNLRFLEHCGATLHDDGRLEIWLTAADRRFAAEVIGGVSCIAFGCGAGDAARRWPLDRFAAVAGRLACEFGVLTVQLGASGEPSFGAGLDLVGHTTLRQAAAVMERAALFVGNDSGLKHLAAAVGTPVVEISAFSRCGDPDHPNSPARFHAWGVPQRVVQPPPGASVLAITEIDVASVMAACRDVLATSESACAVPA